MSYGQYSKTALATPSASSIRPTDDDASTAGSSSFSSWQSLMSQTTKTRRNLGRLKTNKLPQRPNPLFLEEEEDEKEDDDSRNKVGKENKTGLGIGHHEADQSKLANLSNASNTTLTESNRNNVSLSTSTTNRSAFRSRFDMSSSNHNSSRLTSGGGHHSRTLELKQPQRLGKKPTALNLPPPIRPEPRKHFGHPISPRPSPSRRTLGEGMTSPFSLRHQSRSPPGSPKWSAAQKMSAQVRSQSTPPPVVAAVNRISPPAKETEQPQRQRELRAPPEPSVRTIEKEASVQPKLTVNGKEYSIIEKIGKGGSSEVFGVIDKASNKIRAVKKVDLSDVSDGEAMAFRNEVKLLMKLRGQKRIIRLIDHEERPRADRRGTDLFVVMEHGEKDLSSLLKEMSNSERGLTNTKTKFYWEEMLEAVQVVHKLGVVHSDLKPANFLIVSGTLKLIDFGIASAVVGDNTHITKDNLMGTFNFMSPEAIQDQNNGGSQKGSRGDQDEGKPIVKISFKSDVWSLGCILYNMVYKKMPFSDFKHPVAKLQAIIDPDHKIPFPRDAKTLRDHDPLVVEVLERCLVRDPAHRASIEELLEHPYLKSDKNSSNVLSSDQLLNAIGALTPNTRSNVLASLTGKASTAKPPPPPIFQE